MTQNPTPKALYPRLVGAAWTGLPPLICRFHDERAEVRGEARFSIRRGRGLLVALAAWIMGLPRAGEGVLVRLRVERSAALETWHRDFGGQPLLTRQYEGDGLSLVERAGPLELVCRLSAEGGALTFTPRKTRLCLGPLRIPLPRWLSLFTTARVEEEGNAMRILVKVEAPMLGLLVSYSGLLWPSESPDA